MRELENVVREAVVLATDHLIRAKELLISVVETLGDERVDESLKVAKAGVVEGFEPGAPTRTAGRSSPC